MAEKNVDITRELKRYRNEYGLIQKIPFSHKENKQFKQMLEDGGILPEGVVEYRMVSTGEPIGKFYLLQEADLTDAEITEYLTYKKLDTLRTIKNCVVFFTVLAAVSLALGFLSGFFAALM